MLRVTVTMCDLVRSTEAHTYTVQDAKIGRNRTRYPQGPCTLNPDADATLVYLYRRAGGGTQLDKHSPITPEKPHAASALSLSLSLRLTVRKCQTALKLGHRQQQVQATKNKRKTLLITKFVLDQPGSRRGRRIRTDASS